MVALSLNTHHDNYRTNNRSLDRILVLKSIDGKDTLDSKGLVDKRLFTGENKLHAIMDVQSCLWYLKYDMGGLPPALKQQFTSFPRLLNYTKDYFLRRNIEISEIID